MSTDLVRLDNAVVESIAKGFLAQTEAVQSQVRQLIANHPFSANAAIVAGEFAIRDAMSNADKAFILMCKRRGKLLIEGAKGDVADEKVFDVVAEAASKCLAFPSRDFSVWGNGTLYVKEDGFRRWFAARGDCTDLDVDPEAPVWKKLQDRSCWEVPGKASVKVRGRSEPVTVKCIVQVNGYSTDNPEKIAAHATRSLLKRLWKKIDSSIPLDNDPDDGVSVTVIEHPAAAITHGEPQQTYNRAPVSRPPETERTTDLTPRGQMRSRLERQPEKLNLIEGWWNAVDAAKTMAALTDLWNTMTVSESANDVTAGDLKELKAEFTRRKVALQSVKP